MLVSARKLLYDFARDVRFAARTLKRRPLVPSLTLSSLALGFGGLVTVLALIDGSLRRPLPYEGPDELVALWENAPAKDIRKESTSTPNFLDWQRQSRSFSRIAATSATVAQNLTTREGGEEVLVSGVTEGFFSLLRVRPVLGRAFSAEEHTEEGFQRVLLSDRLWQRLYGRDPGAIGESLILNRRSFTILGVLPSTYRHPDWSSPAAKQPDVWIPMPLPVYEGDRRYDWLQVIGRLATGISLTEAQAEMSAVSGRLAQEFPQDNAGFQAEVTPLHRALHGHLRQPFALSLGAAAGFLLVVCSNVVILLLCRSRERQTEMAVRRALGANRSRLLRQMLAEALLLGLTGALLGLALGSLSLFMLRTTGQTFGLEAQHLKPGATSLLVVLGLSLLLSCALGWIMSRSIGGREGSRPLTSSGSAAAGKGSVGSPRLRHALVTVEVGLTFVLLFGAALLLRSYRALLSEELGFSTGQLVTAEVTLPIRNSSSDPRTADFLQELLERLRALPGVDEVGAVSALPLSGDPLKTDLELRVGGGAVPASDVERRAVLSVATPGYFHAMKIPLRKGRLFWPSEMVPVALINETMARRFFGPADPIGRWLYLGADPPDQPRLILGVVADVHEKDPATPAEAHVYLLHRQRAYSTMRLVLRSSGREPSSLIPEVERTLKSMDRTQYLARPRSGDQLLAASIADKRFAMTLATGSSLLAFLLALVGVYGITSYSVTQRTSELGLRIALGARRRDLLASVLRPSLSAVVVGLAAGAFSASFVLYPLSRFLFRIPVMDPLTFLEISLLLGMAALLAAFIPALRATRIDPNQALRQG